MDRDWPEAARVFAGSVVAALADAGGVDLARRAEETPAGRGREAQRVLGAVGLFDLDVTGDEDESAAAMLGVRAAGGVGTPWPVCHRLATPRAAAADVDGVYVARGAATRLDHADMFARAVVVDVSEPGRVRRIVSAEPGSAPLDPFGCLVRTEPLQSPVDFAESVGWHCVLDAFWVLGALGTVVGQAARYSTERRQFGRPIGSFGEIRWRLADMVVARDGLDELARYSWWAMRTGRAGPADALALRLGMLEAAATVLANGHQVFGAVGLCEEHDLAVLDRHLQPVLNRPCGQNGTAALLGRAVAAHGFVATFPIAARA